MRVSEVLDFDDYYRDPRFAKKHPRHDRTWREASGDNIYHRAEDGRWLQDPNRFHGPERLEKDTGGAGVYISEYFYYFGENAIEIPAAFSEMIRDRQGTRCGYTEELVAAFVAWLENSFAPGVHGKPRDRIKDSPTRCGPNNEARPCGQCAAPPVQPTC